MSLEEAILADMEEQRVLQEAMTVYETVEAIDDCITTSNDPSNEIISLQLCVLEASTFKQGWHLTLIDKDASCKFEKVKSDLEKLKKQRKSKYLFRLTIWEGKKRARKDPPVRPGSLLFCDNVTQLKFYGKVGQGETTLDEVMKVEDTKPTGGNDETKPSEGKKAKTTK